MKRYLQVMRLGTSLNKYHGLLENMVGIAIQTMILEDFIPFLQKDLSRQQLVLISRKLNEYRKLLWQNSKNSSRKTLINGNYY